MGKPGHNDKNELLLYGEAYAYPLSLRVSSHCTWHVIHINLKIMIFLRMWAKRDEVQSRCSILTVPGCTKSSGKTTSYTSQKCQLFPAHSLHLIYLEWMPCHLMQCSIHILYTSGHVTCTPTTNCLRSCTEEGGCEGYHFNLSFIHSQQ